MSQATFAKSLTIYFSRADENYGVGYVKEGNTAKLAKIIAEKTGSDLHEISPVTAYPKQYKAATEVARTEKRITHVQTTRQILFPLMSMTLFILVHLYGGGYANGDVHLLEKTP